MKKEYDFSRGKRGKFYCDGAELLLPDMGSKKTDYLEFKERLFRDKSAKALYNEIVEQEKTK